MAMKNLDIREDYASVYGFHDENTPVFKARPGLDHELIEQISLMKKEPQWMRDIRHKSLDIFHSKPMPTWGNTALLNAIDFAGTYYYLKPTNKEERKWEDVPPEIKKTFDRLGIPEAERKFLAGVTAQYESEVVYHSVRKDLEDMGVIFLGMDEGLRLHEDLVKKYFGTIIPPADNKFAALNTAIWSGGSFIYVPPGKNVEAPLQAYFRINAEKMGQFERTLIIADKGSKVHYIEGCTAPSYSADSLHSAVVELLALPGAHIRYTTIQNWSNNVYNLVTKRAIAHENSIVEWVDGNLGSKLTMKYPSIYLVGEGARGEVLSCAYAGSGQHQDAGAKVIHAAPRTSSQIISKSVSRGGGRSSYRGLVKIYKGAVGSKVNVRCDALLLDPQSRSDTYPTMEV
ncbi:MAG TPA: Fe-S cluster assembly protein SufB, partial [Thermoplasmata archaeon]|nr:Fe-S cluster assembly protein SufB [Thermoplasmata archaeon]